MHASRWFIRNLDGVFQDPLRDDVAVAGGGRLSAHKHSEVLVASLGILLQKFLQRAQPASNQMDVLTEEKTSKEMEK